LDRTPHSLLFLLLLLLLFLGVLAILSSPVAYQMFRSLFMSVAIFKNNIKIRKEPRKRSCSNSEGFFEHA